MVDQTKKQTSRHRGKKPRHSAKRNGTVRIYSDFRGVLSPYGYYSRTGKLVESTLEQPELAESKDGFDIDTAINCDRLIGYGFSSELAGQLANMIADRQMRWYWLTSDNLWTPIFDQTLGFDRMLTKTRSVYERRDKPRVVRRAIKHSSRMKPTQDVIWCDSDFDHKAEIWRQLNSMAKHLDVAILKITTEASVGLTRQQFQTMCDFVQNESVRHIGVTFA